ARSPPGCAAPSNTNSTGRHERLALALGRGERTGRMPPYPRPRRGRTSIGLVRSIAVRADDPERAGDRRTDDRCLRPTPDPQEAGLTRTRAQTTLSGSSF